MSLVEHVRALVEATPPGAFVMIPRDAAAAWLAEEPTSEVPAVDPLDDLTAAEFAHIVKRTSRTVCEWFSLGLVEGAVKLRGREWRVPREKARAFLDAQEKPSRLPPAETPTLRLETTTGNLASWREPGLNCYGKPYKRASGRRNRARFEVNAATASGA